MPYKSTSSTHPSSSITNPRTIMKWFHTFCFNTNPKSRHQQKANYPTLLEENRYFKDELLQFAKNNLLTLRIELLHNHVQEVMLPYLVEEKKNIFCECLKSAKEAIHTVHKTQKSAKGIYCS